MRRYCMLDHHPDDQVAADYWASLLGPKKRYRAEDRCVGSWSDDDDDPFGPCEEGRSTTDQAPSIDARGVRCVDLTCTMNESSSEEILSHGTFDRLHFVRGRDGELYVDRIVTVHWMGGKPR